MLKVTYFLLVTGVSKKKKKKNQHASHQHTYQQSVLQSADQPTRRIEHFRIFFTSSYIKPQDTSCRFQQRFIITLQSHFQPHELCLCKEIPLTYTMQIFPKAKKLTCFETAHEEPHMPSFSLENLIWSSEGHRAGSLQLVREA